MVRVTINGQERDINVEDTAPLLWVLRDELGLTGTKFGCGVGTCGACTVHVDGKAVRSCVTALAAAAGKEVTTIEGLATPWGLALRQAWITRQVPQCGYCQPGMIMAAAALPRETLGEDAAIRARITNLCRCGTYKRILEAIRSAAHA